MASFDITAQINLRGPSNVKQIAADIRRQLSNIKSTVNLKLDPKTVQNVAIVNKNFRALNATLAASKGNINAVSTAFNNLNKSMASLSTSSKNAANSVKSVATAAKTATAATQSLQKGAQSAGTAASNLGAEVASGARKFLVFSGVSTLINAVTSSIAQGVGAFVEYERELAKVQQVTNATSGGLSKLSKDIQEAAVSTGAAATELAKVSVVLSQAGLSARETSEALQTLAKTTLAPTFGDITDTTEGAIAILRQFKLETSELETALGSINAVAGAFAVSASDIITAVKQAGAVFASSSQGVSEGTDALNEFIAVFTSVRQTTRESAETIGTGLKTIVTRLQRLDTIQSLKQFGIQLTDLEGKFVGPFEAIKRLSEGLQAFDPRDVRFGAIIEELGGFRQVGKVIPLIQQFAVAQEALNVAREGGTSITDQQIIAERTLSVQLQKTAANFQAFITGVAESDAFQGITKGLLGFVNALISLADILKDVIPVLAALAANAAIPAIAQFAGGFGAKLLGKNKGGAVPHHFARGGYVPGSGDRDTVPAMLTPGEFVIRKKAVQAIGTDKLSAMNGGQGAAIATQAKNKGGMIQHFAEGGTVSVDYAKKKPSASKERELIGNNLVQSVNSLASYYDPESKQLSSRKSPKNLPNYAGIVGGIFESAVELVAGQSDKQKNEAVWDYPSGIGSTDLFNNVPGLGVPTDAKKSATTATVRKKLKAHYRNAQGTDLNRKKFGIVAFGKGEDYEYQFDPEAIKQEVAPQRAAKAQKANRGGLIQHFQDGDLVVAGSGRVTQKDIKEATSGQLNSALQNPKVNAKSRAAIQNELQQRETANNATNVAVVGILPLGYSKDYPPQPLGGENVKISSRGLPKAKEEAFLNIAEGLRGVVQTAAVEIGGSAKPLTPEQEKSTGLENVQGTIFEAVLSALGATGGSIQNQSMDYANGLGPAASLYPGIGPDWPTEVKRDVTGPGFTRSKKNIANFYSAQKFAEGGKVKSKGGLGIKTTGGNTITSVFEDGQSSSGEVVAKSIGQNLFAVLSSQVSGGGGRALYDSAMKQATSQGGSLTSDRSRVSSSALSRIWTTYFNKGTSKDGKKVSKKPVPDNMLYTGAFFDESDYPSPNPASWQGQAVPLQYAYKQFADGGAASGGDTVPAMLTPGEFVINKKAAKSIGLSKLREMNYADKIRGYAKGGPVGGVQYFDNGDTVDPLSQSGGVNPCCPDELKAANTNAKTAKKMEDAADSMNEAGEKQEEAADEMSTGQAIFLAFIGPAIEQGIKKAFPNSRVAAATGEGIQQGAATYQTSSALLGTIGKVLGKFPGVVGKAGKLITASAKGIAVVLGALSFGIGARSGYIQKSIELLSQEIETGAKDTAKAIKNFNDLLLDPNISTETLGKSLGELSNKINDLNTVRGEKAAVEIQQLQPYLPYFESNDDKQFRQASERNIEREAFETGAQDALTSLEAALQNGKKLGDIFDNMSKKEAQGLKKAIAFQDKAIREQIKALEKQRDATEEGTPEREALNEQIAVAIDTGYVENAQRLKIIAQLKEAERAVEENRRRLVNSSTSLEKYVEAFGTAIAIAGNNFQVASLEAKSFADGFAGVDLQNLFAAQITTLENPRAFNDAENAISLDPLKGVLGDNAKVFAALVQLPNRLEDAINSAAAGAAGQDSENVGRAISAAISGNLGEFEGTALGDALVGSLTEQIEKASKGGKGTADTTAIIDSSTDIVRKTSENFTKAAVEALKLIREAGVQVASFAQVAETSFKKFNRGLLLAAQGTTRLNQDIDRLVSGRNDPRSISDINARTTGAARSEVSGVAQFIQQNADAQKQLIDLQSRSLQAQMEGAQSFNQNVTEIGRVKAEIIGLRQQTENLRTALTDKLGELKNELSNRLSELKEQSAASRSLIDSVFSDEQGANESFDAAMRLANGDASGISSGPEALKVLKEISRLQQAGLIPDDPKVIENAYKRAAKAAGIQFSPEGLKVFKQAFANPEDDSEVKAYVKELRATNAEINQLTNVLNLQELQNSNDALIASQTALTKVMSDLPETINTIAEKIQASGLKAPIEVLEAGNIKVSKADRVDIRDTLGASQALPTTKAVGGIIYRSTGGEGPASSVSTGPGSNINWAPRGSDTVPAMLTPGEYVVNAQATKANRGLLENINSGKGKKVQPIYRASGGPTDTSERGWIDYFDEQTQSGRGFLESIYSFGGVTKVWPDIATKLGGLGDTLGSWYGSAKDTVNSGLASQFTKFGNYKGQILPKYIIEAIKTGTITETKGLASVPKKAWSNLIPRIINNVGNTKLAQDLTKWGGSKWAKASPTLNTAVQAEKYADDIAPSVFKKTFPKIMKSQFAKGTFKNLPIAEWAVSGLLASRNRWSELERKGGSTNQMVMSSLAEFLAGGTAGAPTDSSGYSGIASAGIDNASRLFSNIYAGFQRGGPQGAVAAGLVTVGAMGIRLAEETRGWRLDAIQEMGSFQDLRANEKAGAKSAKQQERDRIKDFKEAGVKDLEYLDSQIDILGLTQFKRAQRYGGFQADKDFYGSDNNPYLDMDIDTEAVKSREYNEWVQQYWNGKVNSSAFMSNKGEMRLIEFDPALIPEIQKASFRSGNVFENRYSDDTIQKAYNKVASQENKKKTVELKSLGGKAVGVYPNAEAYDGSYPKSLDSLTQSIDDRSESIYQNTQGVKQPDGTRDETQTGFNNIYSKDTVLRDIDDELATKMLASNTFFNRIPRDLTTNDKQAFEDSKRYTQDVTEIAKRYTAREEELKQIAREERDAQAKAEADRAKEKVDANAATQTKISNISAFATSGKEGLKDLGYKEFYPYIDKSSEINKLQADSIKMRGKLNAQAAGPTLNLGQYVDFEYGKLGKDANTLLKSQEAIQIPTDVAAAVAEYRKNYVQSSPLYEKGIKRFADSITEWEFNQEEPNIAAAIRRSIFTGQQINPGVIASLTANNEASDPDLAVQMGYDGDIDTAVQQFTKDREQANVGKVRPVGGTVYEQDKVGAEAYLAKLKDAKNAVKNRNYEAQLAKLDPDQRMESTLVQLLAEETPILNGYLKGINFYRDGNVDKLGGGEPPNAGWTQGFADMAGAVEGRSDVLLKAGQSEPLSEGKLDYGKTWKYYARLMNDAQNLSADATPEQIKAREGNIQQERAVADAQQATNNKRYDAAVRFGKALAGTRVPTDSPVAWVKYRQAQLEKFRVNVAQATNTEPDYPEAKDIPALNESGVTKNWVNSIFNSKGEDSVVSQRGAKELLRWKAKQKGENAEALLGLANEIDGNVGFNDIYPFDRVNDTELEAATDLQGIQAITGRFNKFVLTRKNLALPLLERNLENLYKGGLWTPERGLEENLGALNALDPRLDQSGISKKIQKFGPKTQYYSDGGSVFTPRGTDTVPAMLTPGEYVVNRKAAAQNRPLLEAINGKQSRAKNSPYYHDGGDVTGNGVNNVVVDTQEISKFVTSFDRFAKELASLNVPEQITIQGTHTVEVNVNGGQVLNDLLNGPIGDLVRTEIASAFEQQNQDSEGTIPNPFNPATNP